MIPSVEDAAMVEYKATAANTPLPYATEDQFEFEGNVLAVQVMPSVDEAAFVDE